MTCRYRASEPEKWDYDAAGIPTPLTEEMESQQQAKQVLVVLCSKRYHMLCSRGSKVRDFLWMPQSTHGSHSWCISWKRPNTYPSDLLMLVTAVSTLGQANSRRNKRYPDWVVSIALPMLIQTLYSRCNQSICCVNDSTTDHPSGLPSIWSVCDTNVGPI